MSEAPFDAAAHVAHMERVLALPIAPQWRAGVEAHVVAIAGAAALVMSFPLADEVEHAFAFEAGVFGVDTSEGGR